MDTPHATERVTIQRLMDGIRSGDPNRSGASLQLPDMASIRAHLAAFAEILFDGGLDDSIPHSPLYSHDVNSKITHEIQHTEAIVMLNGIIRGYRLLFVANQSSPTPHWGLATVWQPTRQHTPLEIVSVALHPQVPSPLDMKAVKQLGFSSARAAAEEILLHNTSDNQPVPEPLGLDFLLNA